MPSNAARRSAPKSAVSPRPPQCRDRKHHLPQPLTAVRQPLALLADIIIVVALAGHTPGLTPWLPLVPLLVLLPHVVQRLRLVWPHHAQLQVIPDPLQPQWREAARGIAMAVQRAAADRSGVELRLAPLCGASGAALPWQLDFKPATSHLIIEAASGTPPRTTRQLSPMPRLRLPLPLRVAATPQLLHFHWHKCGTREVVVATQPARQLFPHRTPYHTLLRYWIGTLGILRLTTADLTWFSALQDPLGLLIWVWLAPILLIEIRAWTTTWRQRRRAAV